VELERTVRRNGREAGRSGRRARRLQRVTVDAAGVAAAAVAASSFAPAPTEQRRITWRQVQIEGGSTFIPSQEVQDAMQADGVSAREILDFLTTLMQDGIGSLDTQESIDQEALQRFVDSLPVADEGTRADCAICLDDGPESCWRSLPCGHSFHEACLHQWLSTSSKSRCCPLCRSDCIFNEEPDLADLRDAGFMISTSGF